MNKEIRKALSARTIGLKIPANAYQSFNMNMYIFNNNNSVKQLSDMLSNNEGGSSSSNQQFKFQISSVDAINFQIIKVMEATVLITKQLQTSRKVFNQYNKKKVSLIKNRLTSHKNREFFNSKFQKNLLISPIIYNKVNNRPEDFYKYNIKYYSI